MRRKKSRIKDAIARVKKALEGDDLDAIKKAQEELMNVSHKLAEAMYAKTAGGVRDWERRAARQPRARMRLPGRRTTMWWTRILKK